MFVGGRLRSTKLTIKLATKTGSACVVPTAFLSVPSVLSRGDPLVLFRGFAVVLLGLHVGAGVGVDGDVAAGRTVVDDGEAFDALGCDAAAVEEVAFDAEVLVDGLFGLDRLGLVSLCKEYLLSVVLGVMAVTRRCGGRWVAGGWCGGYANVVSDTTPGRTASVQKVSASRVQRVEREVAVFSRGDPLTGDGKRT